MSCRNICGKYLRSSEGRQPSAGVAAALWTDRRRLAMFYSSPLRGCWFKRGEQFDHTTFRIKKIAVLLRHQVIAQRHHEKYTQNSAGQREPENSPDLQRVAQKEQRRNGVDHPRGDRFPCGAHRLHDVVFQDRRSPEIFQYRDGKDGDGNRGAEIQPHFQCDVDGDEAENYSQERTEEDCAQREFRLPGIAVFFVGHFLMLSMLRIPGASGSPTIKSRPRPSRPSGEPRSHLE